MRVAVLCDIHGNLPALEAVLAEVDADLVVVGGDVAAAAERLRASGFPDVDELMLRESLLEPVGSAFIARHFEERATRG